MTRDKEFSISHVTQNRFHSDQQNERFNDLISNHTVENRDLKFEYTKKGSSFLVYLLGGVMVDHRGIRFDFDRAEPLDVTFNSNLDGKKYIRLAVYYDKRIVRNFDMTLKAYGINDLKSEVGTYKQDYNQFHVGTFEVSGNDLVLVDRPFYHGEEVQIQIKELHERITKEVETLNNRIDKEVETINNRVDKEVETINNRVDKEISDVNDKIKEESSKLGSEINKLEKETNELESEMNTKVRDRVGMKKTKKGEEKTFEVVETFDPNNKLRSKSVLSGLKDGKYTKRKVTLHAGTKNEVTYNLQLIYDNDGDLIEERKI